MKIKTINKAIRPLGVEIIHDPRHKYSYFLDLNTGCQVGEGSAWGCCLSDLTLEQWVTEAEEAVEFECRKWYTKQVYRQLEANRR